MQPKTVQAKPDQAQNWPIIDNVIGPLADWWRRHARIQRDQSDLSAFGADEMARMAQDVGITASDLRSLASHCAEAADLLEQRVKALGLSTAELGQTAPAELRDMERLCTLCVSKGRCARDLAADPADPAWHQYCPNEGALSELASHRAAR